MNKLNILLTGGTGFFGKSLFRHWSNTDEIEIKTAKFTVLSRNPEQFKSQHHTLFAGLDVELVKGDIQLPETLPVGNYTHIIHAATDSTTGLDLSPLQRYEQIVDGTRNVLNLALLCNKPRFLLTSSGGVYGKISQFRNGVPEDYCGIPDPLEPQNTYSIAKRQAEHLCALYGDAYGIQYVIARCFAFVGQDLPMNAHFAIGNFISDVLSGKDIIIQGDGTPVRSYMDQRDLAHWLTTLMLRGKNKRAYNVGSSEAVSIVEAANKVSSLFKINKTNIVILNKPSSESANSRSFYLPDIARIKKELDLELRYTLNESIQFIINNN